MKNARSDRGATAAEYALLISLVAVVIFIAVAALGTNLSALIDWSCDEFTAATSGSSC